MLGWEMGVSGGGGKWGSTLTVECFETTLSFSPHRSWSSNPFSHLSYDVNHKREGKETARPGRDSHMSQRQWDTETEMIAANGTFLYLTTGWLIWNGTYNPYFRNPFQWKKRNIRITRKSRNEVMHHLTQELAFTERVNEKGRAKLSPNVTKCQSSRRTFDNPRQIESELSKIHSTWSLF